MTFREVTSSEYLAFLAAYPEKLEFHCDNIVEPPVETMSDESLPAKWPANVVAKCVREWLGPDKEEQDHSMPGKFWRYYVRTDLPVKEPAK